MTLGSIVKVDNFLMLFLALGVCYRGALPSLFCEGIIFFVFVYYILTKQFDLKNIIFFGNNKFVNFFYSLSFVVFSYSLIIYQSVESLKIFYTFFLILPFSVIFSEPKRARIFVIISSILVAIVFFICLFNLLNIIRYDEVFYIRDGKMRAKGFMGSPNYMAYNSAAVFLLLYYGNLKFRLKNLFLLFIFGSVLLTASRGVTIGLVFCLIFSNFKFNKTGVYSLILGFIVTLYIFIYKPPVLTTFFERFSSLVEDGNSSGRTDIWTEGYYLWSENLRSIYFGFGFNNFENLLSFYGVDNTVHNSFLRLLFEFGIIGFIFVILFFNNSFSSFGWKFNRRIVLILTITLMWLTNDFFLLRENFLMITILYTLSLSEQYNISFLNKNNINDR
ncbi:O-antigen ligase family protein [Riemerella anatipestifer]|nr:O-antigen ligase family protein [Riemerella anatipestifer]